MFNVFINRDVFYLDLDDDEDKIEINELSNIYKLLSVNKYVYCKSSYLQKLPN
jgi:hypothetical protein